MFAIRGQPVLRNPGSSPPACFGSKQGLASSKKKQAGGLG